MTPSAAPAPRVILASQSPRRRDLLTMLRIPHDVRPADVDESVWPGEAPVPHCERLARAKAAVLGIKTLRERGLKVHSLQEYHARKK